MRIDNPRMADVITSFQKLVLDYNEKITRKHRVIFSHLPARHPELLRWLR